jgi:hypothetical protein
VNAGLAAGSNGNNIVNVIRDLGQPLNYVNAAGYSRDVSVSPGRSFAGITKDWGVSGQLDWNIGGTKLTSITAYRDYDSSQGSDTDYSRVDILYRAANGNSARRFRTFTQELRLNGSLFNDKLDWLVGGFFANEDLRVLDNLRFGSQYGRFATCRLVSGSALAQFYAPGNAGCLSATGRAVLSGVVPGVASPFGAAGPTIVGAIDTLDAINDKGATRDVYNQNSRNWALFTHNIFHVTRTVDLTLGCATPTNASASTRPSPTTTSAASLTSARCCPSCRTPALPPPRAASSACRARAIRPQSSTACRSTASARKTSSPARRCCRGSRSTTCSSTAAIRAATRRVASTSTARR